LPNPFKWRSDAAASPSAGPAGEDAHGLFDKKGEAILRPHRQRRVASVQQIAQRKVDATDGQGDGEVSNAADVEANVLSTQRPSSQD